jgi:fibrillarin-like pre-rRNA processing protein
MRLGRRFTTVRGSPRLAELRLADRTEFWTETDAQPPAVYGERWSHTDDRAWRSFDPYRSKLAAGIVRGWEGDLPAAGERWLYLGAASGTTASHVADLVGPDGAVYAIERSLRPFGRLLALAERWPSLLPILADARRPDSYTSLVPPVDGVYADIAQPDQAEIVIANARALLRRPGSRVLFALKTASMGREATAPEHLRRTEALLGGLVELERPVKLEPFHRAHFLVGGRAGAALFREPATRRAPPPHARSPERSRR